MSIIFKIFERIMNFEILIEKWKQIIDDKGYGAAILLDLSKAFGTINHELLIAKLHAYDFTRDSLLIILSCLSDRWQHVKIDSSFSSWTELTQGVPQRSVLGPLLNISNHFLIST